MNPSIVTMAGYAGPPARPQGLNPDVDPSIAYSVPLPKQGKAKPKVRATLAPKLRPSFQTWGDIATDDALNVFDNLDPIYLNRASMRNAEKIMFDAVW
eukprot:2550814-Karenia_brevis.AAC.1